MSAIVPNRPDSFAKPVFVIDCVPGADPGVAWEDICHGQRGRDFIFILYERCREKSRWVSVDNKRPFIVYRRVPKSIGWLKLGASSSLAGALRIARREA